jgi:hypothetical protein
MEQPAALWLKRTITSVLQGDESVEDVHMLCSPSRLNSQLWWCSFIKKEPKTLALRGKLWAGTISSIMVKKNHEVGPAARRNR